MSEALFKNLMISSPNGGGLLFIHHGQVFRLDDLNTTGIDLRGREFLRGFQPEGLVYYQGNQTSECSGTSIHDIHDVMITDSSLYVVGTSANEVVQLDKNAAIVRGWTLSGDIDAKHINCFARWNERLVFSVFGDFTGHRQYKGLTAQAGFVQDLQTGERLIEALSQPHSLVPFGDHLLLANSELKEVREYDGDAKLLRTKTLDGYTRGICIQGKVLYVGLSRSRNIDSGSIENANLVALDLDSWEELGRIELPIAEIYSVLAVDDIDVLPPLLAGISQRSAVDYRHAINERDQQILWLLSTNEQLKLEQVAAAESGDVLPLTQALEDKTQQLEAARRVLAERDGQLSIIQPQLELTRTLLADVTQAKEDQLEALRTSLAERDSHVGAISRLLESAQVLLADVTQAKDNQLDALRVALVERDAQLSLIRPQLESAQLLAVDIAQTKDSQLEALRVALAERDSQLSLLGPQLGAAREVLADVSQAKDSQVQALQASLIERDAQLSAVREELDASAQLSRTLLMSSSWRWTRALRGLRRLLRI